VWAGWFKVNFLLWRFSFLVVWANFVIVVWVILLFIFCVVGVMHHMGLKYLGA
jgi:hypothetical protein